MPLPNFIIFGAIKSGTGALYQYLKHHPEIYMSPTKEPRYFNKQVEENIGNYLKYFEGAETEKAIGEATSSYINSKVAALKIKSVIPNVKLIASLRHPVDRAIAHHRMMYKGKCDIDLKEVKKGKTEGWATTSLYHEKLGWYFDCFEKEQIKILILEHWQKNVADSLRGIYKFLGVDEEYQLPKYINYAPAEVAWPGMSKLKFARKIKNVLPTKLIIGINKTKRMLASKNQEIPNELRQEMLEWYREDIEKLETMLNQDLSIWKR